MYKKMKNPYQSVVITQKRYSYKWHICREEKRRAIREVSKGEAVIE